MGTPRFSTDRPAAAARRGRPRCLRRGMRPPDRSPRPACSTARARPGRRPGALRRTLDGVRRAVLLRRRSLAVLLAAVAVLTGVRAATAPPEPTTTVLVAAATCPAALR